MKLINRLQKKSGYQSPNQIKIVVSRATGVVIQESEFFEFVQLTRLRPNVVKAVSDYLMMGKKRIRSMWLDEKMDKLTGKVRPDNFEVPVSHFGG